MDRDSLRVSSRPGEADWIVDRLRPFGSGVASIVPAGFHAYVRILHPAHGVGNQLRRWSEIAAECGRTMHRLAQFHAIARPESGGSSGLITPPDCGNLASNLLIAVCDVLRRHTQTSQSCYFCLWDGYGWLNETDSLSPAICEALRNPDRVLLAYRDYLVFEGPLKSATELGWALAGEDFIAQSPNLFWPRDRAWCAASEIDLPFTLVAGSDELAERLLADPNLEAWRVFPDDPVDSESDLINL